MCEQRPLRCKVGHDPIGIVLSHKQDGGAWPVFLCQIFLQALTGNRENRSSSSWQLFQCSQPVSLRLSRSGPFFVSCLQNSLPYGREERLKMSVKSLIRAPAPLLETETPPLAEMPIWSSDDLRRL